MSEWQPIKTAPTDGSVFIAGVYVNHYSRRNDTFTKSWDCQVVWIDDETGEISGDCNAGFLIGDYTHWMPIPDPPGE